jgi:hypothetical protein
MRPDIHLRNALIHGSHFASLVRQSHAQRPYYIAQAPERQRTCHAAALSFRPGNRDNQRASESPLINQQRQEGLTRALTSRAMRMANDETGLMVRISPSRSTAVRRFQSGVRPAPLRNRCGAVQRPYGRGLCRNFEHHIQITLVNGESLPFVISFSASPRRSSARVPREGGIPPF